MLAATAARGILRAETGGRSALWDFFMRELAGCDERRRRRLAGVHTKDALAELQEHTRRTLAAGIGAFPERTPLEARVVGEITRADYVIERIIFQSRPDYYVTANLYRPKSGTGRRPGVVQTCGHYEEGKTAPDYACACAGLAMKGCVALIFDPMGQGERVMFRDAAGKPLYKGATGEHSAAGRPTLLVGRTLANYRIWDIMRALDYLESRPEVDPSRLGLFGHSGGGMMTLLTAPLEPRAKAVMSCCAVTTFYHKTQALLMADPEQIVPGVYRAGVDHPELIAAVAPRAFLIGAVLRDYVPLDGTRRTYDEARPLFALAGVPENLAKVESDNVHKLDKNLREACYGWMQQHLLGETGDKREPEIRVESAETLRCTRSGSVMELARARSVFDLNREEARRLAGMRKAGAKPRLVLGEPFPPAEQLWPARKRKDVLCIVAAEGGRGTAAAQKLTEGLTKAGVPVLGVDLRGWGETTPDPPGKKAKFSWEEFFAWRAIELGRPLLGMRVGDLLSAVRGRADEYRKIYLVGIEAGGVVALHAAAMEPAVAGVACWQTLSSWESVLERIEYREPVSSFLPGGLREYDLPELARGLAPRPVVLLDAHDGLRRATGPAAADPVREIVAGLKLGPTRG
jgi:cephalosporin-C deacetylase-like acetyl esterase